MSLHGVAPLGLRPRVRDDTRATTWHSGAPPYGHMDELKPRRARRPAGVALRPAMSRRGTGAASDSSQGDQTMQLTRIIFAGVMLFGAGCAMPEEENQRVDPTNLDDSITHESEAAAHEGHAAAYAIDETIPPSNDFSEAASDEAGSEVVLGGGGHHWHCCWCHYDEHHHDYEHCHCPKADHRDSADSHAQNACSSHSQYCYFKECYEHH
jgi:hypothetical protein